MNVVNTYDIDSIIRDLEAIFQVDGSDYEEVNVDLILKNIRQRILRQHAIDLNEFNIDSDELELGVYRTQTYVYIDNLARLHASLCGMCQIYRYLADTPISLKDANYLGFTEQSMKTVLITLQRIDTMPMASEAIQSIKGKLSSVSTSKVKRLFMLAIIAYELGVKEITAAIAEILYLGGYR